jgi:hypothetical protein
MGSRSKEKRAARRAAAPTPKEERLTPEERFKFRLAVETSRRIDAQLGNARAQVALFSEQLQRAVNEEQAIRQGLTMKYHLHKDDLADMETGLITRRGAIAQAAPAAAPEAPAAAPVEE